MTREQAIENLKLKRIGYEMSGDTLMCEIIDIAVADMEYCEEVKRYGSELAMMIAHHEKDMKEREEFAKECKIFDEQMKEWREGNG